MSATLGSATTADTAELMSAPGRKRRLRHASGTLRLCPTKDNMCRRRGQIRSCGLRRIEASRRLLRLLGLEHLMNAEWCRRERVAGFTMRGEGMRDVGMKARRMRGQAIRMVRERCILANCRQSPA